MAGHGASYARRFKDMLILWVAVDVWEELASVVIGTARS